MGLIKAISDAVGGTLEDQWKEYIYCDSIPADVLVMRARKRTGGKRGSNEGNDNTISNGSVVAVNAGQCMIIVENGKVVDICAEEGTYTYKTDIQPSIFTGDLKDNVKDIFKQIGKRFTFGGDVGADQRVYFFNTKEIVGNKYGTPGGIPFRVVDEGIGFDMDITVKCFGEYSYRISNPILFYTNVCGNVGDEYRRSEIDSQLKSELMTSLQPAFAKISEQGIRYSAIPAHTTEIADALNEVLSKKWAERRGIEVVEFGVNSIKADEEDEKLLKEEQRRLRSQMHQARTYSDPRMAAGFTVASHGEAMTTAAANSAGAMTGFMGMGMAGGMGGGVSADSLFKMAQQQPQQQAAPQQAPNTFGASAGGNTWKCSCGNENTGKFCVNCGSKKPEVSGWTCSCGSVNQGKFCPNCGGKKPVAAPLYRCDKCGWQPADPKNPPKFCPECGDVFNDNDIIG